MRIFLVRHGETDWNAQSRVQGHSDIPLNANGLGQAKQAARYFSAVKFDKVYSSDLSRAIETARILSGGISPIERPQFRERFFGPGEGAVTKEWREKYGTDPFGQGETQEEVAERTSKAFLEVVKESEAAGAENVLIAAHGGCLRTLVKELVSSGIIDGGAHAHEAVHGAIPFVNCAMTLIEDKVLVEYGLAITDANARDA